MRLRSRDAMIGNVAEIAADYGDIGEMEVAVEDMMEIVDIIEPPAPSEPTE